MFDASRYALAEMWITILTTLIAAMFYAYLAGIVVEVISRNGERKREVNAVFDSLVEYMDAIGFPDAKRKNFLRFFWNARRFLTRRILEDKLPELSEQVTPAHPACKPS